MPKYDVFLSHNSADKPAVEELARWLVKEGIQPWLDKWNLIPGEPWQEAIEEALDSCASCAVFVGPSGTGPWQNEEMRAAVQRRVDERHAGERPFRVIPVLLPGAERGERSRLPSFLVAATWVEFRRTLDDREAFHRLVCGIRGVEPGPAPGEAIYEGECPYRGLRFFDVEHAPFFFGREALTEWLLDELRGENRFLAVIGPSGSGKSSLARAGLVAALKQGKIDGSEAWPVVICRPGPHPLESVAVALGEVKGVAQTPSEVRDLMHDLREGERLLHLTARLTLRNAPPERRLILLVDQFEELFTLCHDEELRQAFVDNSLYAASVAEGQTVVLLTLRADFYSKCAAYPRLAEALSDHQVLVGAMTDDELRRAIERPALLAGCEFEPGLVEKLLSDVKDQPGGLPLLQHALLELWERRQVRRLTHAAYREIGGVEGALERRADRVYESLTPQEQEICRRVFLRLTQPGEGTEDTKRRASLHELLPAEGEREAVEAVVQRLAAEEARLVTTEGGDVPEGERFVEVAHEALIRGWSRLREWIEEDRESLRIHRRLTEAAEEWEKHAQDEDFLYRGGRLAALEEWAEPHADDLNPLERAFLEASVVRRVAEKRAERWRKLGMIAVLGVVVVSILVGIRLVEQTWEKERLEVTVAALTAKQTLTVIEASTASETLDTGLPKQVDLTDMFAGSLQAIDVYRLDPEAGSKRQWLVLYKHDLTDQSSPIAGVVYRAERGGINEPPIIFPYPLRLPDRDFLGVGAVSVRQADVITVWPGLELVVENTNTDGVVTEVSIFHWHNIYPAEAWRDPEDGLFYECMGFFRTDGGIEVREDEVVVKRLVGDRSQLASYFSYRPDERGSYLVDGAVLRPFENAWIDFASQQGGNVQDSPYPEKIVLTFYNSVGGPTDSLKVLLTRQAQEQLERGTLDIGCGWPFRDVKKVTVRQIGYYPGVEAQAKEEEERQALVELKIRCESKLGEIGTERDMGWFLKRETGQWKMDQGYSPIR